ncbi:hypothetical protein G6F56_006675 [Rhizopus delemar]|uniref:Uncharacterized protein n=1 Tax=Rhizopus stolonifer TaxID=4846 RepID=A0A367JXS4_RHIST|nr:hypothetical protein G6F56_006675 [Rhizopus delemar]RCH94746.1 hypothetical protein CU098_007398 [Rhizopus stolonifer]
MVRFHTLIFATLASVYALSPEAASKLKSELATGNIIPQIFDDFEPKVELKVQYDNMVLTNGMEITSTQANQAPMVSFESLSSDKDYTVAMFDANTRLYHWVVTNIHGVENDGTSASVQIPYKETIPNHRYVFAVFEQTEKDQFLSLSDHFDLKELDTNRLQLASALYMNQKDTAGLKKRAEEAPNFRNLANNLADNLRGVLKEYGVELGRQSVNNEEYEQGRSFASSFQAIRSILDERRNINANVNIASASLLDQGMAFASSFQAIKSVLDDRQKVHNVPSASIHAMAVPTSGYQVNGPLIKGSDLESIKSIQSVIDRVARGFQNRASASAAALQTPAPSYGPSSTQNKSMDNSIIDDLLSVMESILDLHKKVSDQVNKNRPTRERVDEYEYESSRQGRERMEEYEPITPSHAL